ncbi:MAG TPA: hypothetical protein PKA53_03180 [Sphingobacterium sp.]|nr:hypothetical protein [Sphingobacterium sp.]
MFKPYYLLYLFLVLPVIVWGQQYQRIDNFIVKENLTSNGKIAIIAVDSAENANENINGTFKFSINGFEQSLAFHDGVAVSPHPIESSTFAYFKHKNLEKTSGKFYFLYKKDNEINPIQINGLLLLLIPTVLLLIAYVMRRFMVTLLILAIAYAYFSFSKGLSVVQILESAYNTILNLFLRF